MQLQNLGAYISKKKKHQRFVIAYKNFKNPQVLTNIKKMPLTKKKT